jgi:hypothetical protein
MSELHFIRLCRTEPVAPALPCADLVGAASRREILKLWAGYRLLPYSELCDYTPYIGGTSSSQGSILVASIKRSDIIKDSDKCLDSKTLASGDTRRPLYQKLLVL